MRNRQIRFARRPDGAPGLDTFATNEAATAAPADGEILCRNIAASVDPYLRLKMYQRKSYTPPLEIGELIPGRTIADVVESRFEGLKPGDHVLVNGGWQDYAVVPGKTARKVDLALASPGAWLGPLGMTGMTAYAGLMQIGRPEAGETIVVSGAAGAVGSLVGQIGKVLGCHVVGIAGGPEKCRTVIDEFGFDACLDYRADDLAGRLAAACPDGIDIYFDNVGGAIARTVMAQLNDFARVPLCGLISQYDGQQPADAFAYDELTRLILTRRLTIRGFIVSDIAAGSPEFDEVMGGWIKSGAVRHREHVWHGFDQIVPAFLGMLSGRNIGKTIVELAP